MTAAQTTPPAQTAQPQAEQPPLWYGPPPSARPLRLVRSQPVNIPPGTPYDRKRWRADGSTAAARVTRAPDGAPAAWQVRMVVTEPGGGAGTAGRTVYAPTLSAALCALEAIMAAFDATVEAAAIVPPMQPLRLVRPGDDETPADDRTDDDDDGAPLHVAG